MADNTEEVKYSFQGDIKSLKQATESAIQLLDKYQKVVEQAVTTGKFSASAKATQTFNNAINKTTKDVEKMAAKLKSVGDVKLFTGSEASKAFEGTLATVSKQMDTISNATKVTTKDLSQLKTELNAARGAIANSAPQVDKLVASEQRFQRALEVVTTKANQVKSTMDGLKSKMGSAFDPINNRVKKLGSIFDAIKVKVQSFQDKASTAFSRVRTLASAVASAFRRTSTEADKGDTSTRKFAKGLEKVSNVFSKLKTQSSKVTTAFSNLNIATKLATKAATLLSAVKIGEWFAEATKQSISYIENLNLFTVAMGDAVDEGVAFVGTMQELYGMDPSNLMRYAGNFYQLATAIDMPDEAASNLSLTLTKTANDLASLFNVNVETVFDNLSSGMQGMSRAVRKYGMDIRTTTLQQTALTLGITDQVENMSEANRMGLRFLTMMKQATNASGDFARTIETPANQLRIFKEQISQLGRAIGDFLIVPIGKVIVYINGFIMALRTVLTFIGRLLGISSGLSSALSFSSADDGADAISGIGSAAGDASKKLKGLIAPFDELNVLQEDASDAGSGGLGLDVLDPRIAEAIAQLEAKFEDVEMKANKVRDAILNFLGFEVNMGEIISWDFSKLKSNILNLLPQAFQDALASLAPVASSFADTLSTIGQVFDNLWNEHIKPMLSSLRDMFMPVVETLGTLWQSGAQIISGAFQIISDVWVGVLQPVLAAIFDAISNIASIIGNQWRTVIGPVIEYIASGLVDLWKSTLQPIALGVYEIIGKLIELVLALWNNVIAPVVQWLIAVLGPAIRKLVTGIWDIVSAVFKFIGEVIKGLITSLKGVLDFLIGVFTGDWDRAFKGLANIFIGFANMIISAFEFCVNAVIELINAMIRLVYNAVVSLINKILSMLSTIAEFVGIDFNVRITAAPPAIPKQSWGRIPALATGGVVTSPTYAMIGEGAYNEAVIPLDNSPQMQELIQKIADAVDRNDDDKPVDVRVYIGDREWDAFTYESAQRGKKLVGAQPIKEVRT